MDLSIFLSHAGAQKEFTRRLCQELVALGYQVFFDVESIPKGAGVPITPRVLQACRDCKLGIIVLSHEYVQSKRPMMELEQLTFHNPSNPNNLYPLFYRLSIADLSKTENLTRWQAKWKQWKTSTDVISSWSTALQALRNQNGSHCDLPHAHYFSREHEDDYIREIVPNICMILPRDGSYGNGDQEEMKIDEQDNLDSYKTAMDLSQPRILPRDGSYGDGDQEEMKIDEQDNLDSYKTAEKPSSDNWQDVITSCFRGDILSGCSSFNCNSMQCIDIADYLKETASFRKQNEERIHVLKCDQAIMEFCHAIVEAKCFLQDCSAKADFWKKASNSLTKLHIGEAYNVLLPNLIWSKAGLDLAILYAVHSNNIDYNTEIKKRVEECTCVLSRYRPESIEARLNTDREKFYLSLKNPQIPDKSQKKCLTFLAEKWKAYQLMQPDIEATESGGGGSAQYLEVFKIDPHDMHDIGGQKSFLGHGNYGHVQMMSWLGQTVAVKVFQGVDMQEVFKNEASLHARLQHPFIVHMVGWFTDEKDGSCMLVMELAPTDLRKVIERQHFISLPAAIDIMLQISKGMEYLHNKRVIHRDLKPNNVLLEPSSVKEMAAKGYARVKLCDFGLAKVKEVSAKDRSMYTTFKAGTSYYRAPEVLVDDEYEDADKSKYTRKADVFSFAITCSEVLAGKTGPPCYQTTTKKIRESMLKNVRPELPPDCPSHLAQLINRCWDTDPKRRPSFRTVSNTLTYIKFILMRFSDVQRVPYVSVVSPFDEEELKRCVSEDEEYGYREELEQGSGKLFNLAKNFCKSLLKFMGGGA